MDPASLTLDDLGYIVSSLSSFDTIANYARSLMARRSSGGSPQIDEAYGDDDSESD